MTDISTMEQDFVEISTQTYIDEYKKNTDVPLRKILVNNLDRRTTCTDLRSLFSAYGCVEECSICVNIWNIPVAYIIFENEEDAIRVVTENNIILYNVPLSLIPASYYQQPDNLEQLLLTSERLNRIQNSPINSYNFDDLQSDIYKPSLNVLNDDCLKHIFSFLPIIDKVRVEIVCKRWKGLSQESWSRIRTLDFSTSRWGMSENDIICISTVGLCGVFSRCGEFLREISLNCEESVSSDSDIPKSFTIDTLSVVGTFCPNLKKFDTSALLMTAKGLDTLTCTCPNLTTIVLRSWFNITDIETSLEKFFQKVVKLEHFEINDSCITGKCLLLLPEATMHTFIINNCDVRDEYLSEVFKRLINLRDLQIIDCDELTDLTMSAINNHCTNLRILKLKCLSNITMTEFMNTKLVNLEALSVRHNLHLTNEVLRNILQNCPKLAKINAEGCSVNRSTLSLNYQTKLTSN